MNNRKDIEVRYLESVKKWHKEIEWLKSRQNIARQKNRLTRRQA